MFSGSIVALVTPFKNGDVDFGALEKLIEFQISAGTDAVLVCGSTGRVLVSKTSGWGFESLCSCQNSFEITFLCLTHEF